MNYPCKLLLSKGPVFLLALIAGLAIPFIFATAAVPAGPPTFSDPLNIDNAFFPFQPLGLKQYLGSDHGTRTGAVDQYLDETRTFKVDGKKVECRILIEYAYEDEELVERSFNYFAQADDGTVYYFGEVVDNYEDGVVVNHDGSWLVGGATQPSDPPGIGNSSQPAVFMPANPELGDIFKPEDLYPVVDETAVIVGVDLDVQVPAGKFDGAIAVEETTRLAPDKELKWYVPGVGVVKVQTQGEKLRLVTSTLVQPEDD